MRLDVFLIGVAAGLVMALLGMTPTDWEWWVISLAILFGYIWTTRKK